MSPLPYQKPKPSVSIEAEGLLLEQICNYQRPKTENTKRKREA